MLEITAKELNKFSNLNDKVRKVEVRAKDYLLQLEPLLQKQKNEGLIDDFEIEPRVSVFSYDEDYCKSENIELGDEFFIDLLFYNRLLRCFVLIENNRDKLTHQDIGQLHMYINYYYRTQKTYTENPTIGIVLCADKNDTVVKFNPPENQKQIFASKYELYLPTEKKLLEEVKKEIGSCVQEKKK